MTQDKESTGNTPNSFSSFLRARIFPILRNTRIRLSLPGISYEISPEDFLGHQTIDQRLQKLGSIKADLQASISAVEELEHEAFKKKRQVDELEEIVRQLNEDKSATESLLRFPEETFTRVFAHAVSKGHWRGILEGIVIGFLTGAASSFFVWYLTKP